MERDVVDSGISIRYFTAEMFKQFACDELVTQITKVTSRGFGQERDQEDMRAHIFDAQNIGLIYREDELVGFATTNTIHDLDLCYLHGIAIAETGKGLGGVLLKKMLLGSSMNRFGFTTQNPAMYLLAKRCTNSIFPNPQDIPSSETLEIAKNLVQHRPGSMQPSMAVTELYNACLYDAVPIPNDNSVWDWWKSMLRIDTEGKSRDGIVFVGTIY